MSSKTSTSRRVFEIASILAVLSFGAMVVLALIVATRRGTMAVSTTGTPQNIEQAIAVCLVALFGLTTLVLWIEGWMFIWAEWDERSAIRNGVLVIFQVIGPVFAAFILHFLRRTAARDSSKKRIPN
jgi:hypothetical protein